MHLPTRLSGSWLFAPLTRPELLIVKFTDSWPSSVGRSPLFCSKHFDTGPVCCRTTFMISAVVSVTGPDGACFATGGTPASITAGSTTSAFGTSGTGATTGATAATGATTGGSTAGFGRSSHAPIPSTAPAPTISAAAPTASNPALPVLAGGLACSCNSCASGLGGAIVFVAPSEELPPGSFGTSGLKYPGTSTPFFASSESVS